MTLSRALEAGLKGPRPSEWDAFHLKTGLKESGVKLAWQAMEPLNAPCLNGSSPAWPGHPLANYESTKVKSE